MLEGDGRHERASEAVSQDEDGSKASVIFEHFDGRIQVIHVFRPEVVDGSVCGWVGCVDERPFVVSQDGDASGGKAVCNVHERLVFVYSFVQILRTGATYQDDGRGVYSIFGYCHKAVKFLSIVGLDDDGLFCEQIAGNGGVWIGCIGACRF